MSYFITAGYRYGCQRRYIIETSHFHTLINIRQPHDFIDRRLGLRAVTVTDTPPPRLLSSRYYG